MNKTYIFIIRLFLAAAFAVVLWRFFFPDTDFGYVVGLGILLLGLAYVSEYFHNRNRSN